MVSENGSSSNLIDANFGKTQDKQQSSKWISLT